MVSKNLLITLTEKRPKSDIILWKVPLDFPKICFRGTAFWVSYESVKGSPLWGVSRLPIVASPITQGY